LWINLSTNETEFVDITSTIDRKIEALLCHKSQVGDEVGEMVRKWSAEAGKTAGFAFAESFRVLRLKRDQPQSELIGHTES